MISILDRKICAFLCMAALAACADKPPPNLPPQEPSLCTFYTPWSMSPAAAANESIENLRAHAGNQAAHYEKCVTNHPKLDPARPGGPR